MRTKWIKTIPALALAGLVCASDVGSANAYFTTYVTAEGGYTVSWEHREELHEEFHDWNKLVTVSSKEGSVPVFVRVKAYSGSTYALTYTGSDWTDGGDGYWYYKTPLAGGETTTGLNIAISNIPTTATEGTNFNVVVVYETIPATYNTDGSAQDPAAQDWSETLTSDSESDTVEGGSAE